MVRCDMFRDVSKIEDAVRTMTKKRKLPPRRPAPYSSIKTPPLLPKKKKSVKVNEPGKSIIIAMLECPYGKWLTFKCGIRCVANPYHH